jgi:hypothetical protein
VGLFVRETETRSSGNGRIHLMNLLLIVGAASAFAFISVAYAADYETLGHAKNEQEIASTVAVSSVSDAIRAGRDAACKDIVAHQVQHSQAEVEKCNPLDASFNRRMTSE